MREVIVADLKDLPLERSLERWEKCEPKAMAENQSVTATMIAFADAKHDIRVLAREIERLRAQPAAGAQVTVTKEMMQRAGPAFTEAVKRNERVGVALRAALEAALQGNGGKS
jgi:hypothetical protein